MRNRIVTANQHVQRAFCQLGLVVIPIAPVLNLGQSVKLQLSALDLSSLGITSGLPCLGVDGFNNAGDLRNFSAPESLSILRFPKQPPGLCNQHQQSWHAGSLTRTHTWPPHAHPVYGFPKQRESLRQLEGWIQPILAPGQSQPKQPTDIPHASQDRLQQAAASAAAASQQKAEQEAAAKDDSQDVLPEGLDEDLESISFTIEELPDDPNEQSLSRLVSRDNLVHLGGGQYGFKNEQDGAEAWRQATEQAGIDLDAADPSEAFQLIPDALPDLAILADHRAPMSWEEWYQHVFVHKDRAAHRVEQLQTILDNSISNEQYDDAAHYSAELARHQEWDDVSKILEEYSEAIEKEDFGRAAALRDEGGAGLVGWWVANPPTEDPQGHLLRIQPSFGRYLGMTYTARDIAAAQGVAIMVQGGGLQSSMGLGPMGQGMEMIEEEEELSITSEGTPCLEIWVQRNEDGTFNRQTTLLRPPMTELDVSGLESASGAATSVEDPSSSSDTQPREESSPQPSGSGTSGAAAAEVRFDESSNEAAVGGESPSGSEAEAEAASSAASSSSPEQSQPGDSVIGNEASGIKGRLPSRPRRQRHRGRPASNDEEGGPATPGNSGDMFYTTDMPGEQSWILSTTEQVHLNDVHEGLRFGGGPLQNIMRLNRHPATLTALGRHQLVIKADDKLTAQEQRMADATKSLASQLAAGQPVPLHLTISNPNSTEVETMDFNSTGTTKDGKDPIEQMTEQVIAAMQRHAKGQDPPPEMATKETLTDIIRTATMEFLNHASNSTLGKNGQMTYSRLDLSAASTDPFCGTYLGSFGGNGLEVLQIIRTTDKDGDEAVVATKLTGDPNVPAGHISFSAKINRSNRLSARDAYPLELGVLGRYRGTGRVARSGYKEASWVEGELLRFGTNNPATHGAELGFVWTVPGDKRYLVLLNKVELDDPMYNDEDRSS
ncbi:hypothetical protein WJX84_010092 [Apatococcus fuscideae]|uniref:Uncharacterized protein n=1 Tax=Apatococcus fuscideae TaxID=2026836 RepID=A0AAW1TDL2_9CHLO